MKPDRVDFAGRALAVVLADVEVTSLAGIAELLARAGAELDNVGAPNAGLARQAARLIVGLDQGPGPLRCRGCRSVLSGRQRSWCSESCRHRYYRQTGERVRTGS